MHLAVLTVLCALTCLHGMIIPNFDLYHALEPDQDLQHWQNNNWQKLHRVEPEATVKLTFALKQRNVDKLEKLLLQVSDPDSQHYGKYRSVDDITKIVSPSEKTVETVQIWLLNNGVSRKDCQLTLNRDFLVCEMACRVAEKLLPGASFSYYSHPDLKQLYVQSHSRYYVPRYVADHVDFVGGVHRLPNPEFSKTKIVDNPLDPKVEIGGPEGFHVGVYPKILRQRYNLTNSDVGSHPNNSQVVVQFLEQYFHNTDLSEFFSLFVGSDFIHRWRIDKIVGPNGWKSGLEASLDTQYIMGMGANITTWFWSTGGRHQKQEPFLKWLVDVGNTPVVPPVHSVSYGEAEITLSKAYMLRINTEFMKLGLRGVTILFSSGDDGADCRKGKFSPAFPASSPYVTAVGGTAFLNPFAVGVEKGYDISGGGFSNIFKQPKYQASAVATYLNSSKVPDDKYFNRTGRMYPDVASLCRHFWIVNNRVPVPGVMGTSASAPTVAGIISMVNEHRLRANKPVMGFINPFIYKHPEAFYDVTTGYNEGCQRGDVGFYATKGFDPVTGVGSPNFPELVKASYIR